MYWKSTRPENEASRFMNTSTKGLHICFDVDGTLKTPCCFSFVRLRPSSNCWTSLHFLWSENKQYIPRPAILSQIHTEIDTCESLNRRDCLGIGSSILASNIPLVAQVDHITCKLSLEYETGQYLPQLRLYWSSLFWQRRTQRMASQRKPHLWWIFSSVPPPRYAWHMCPEEEQTQTEIQQVHSIRAERGYKDPGTLDCLSMHQLLSA